MAALIAVRLANSPKEACASIEDDLEMAGYLAPVGAVLRNAYCTLEAGSTCSWTPAELEWLRVTQVAGP
jgi:hypothetical protein